MDRAGMSKRLQAVGLRHVAEAYRDEVRQRIAAKKGGKDRAEVSLEAWAEMWDLFRPTVERLEAEAKNAKAADETPLAGCDEDVDQHLDPDYSETDPAVWIPDGLFWAAGEIRRVVVDSEDGPQVDLTRAKAKPPTAWAAFCVEHYARQPPSKRGELIARVLQLIPKAPPTPPTQGPDTGGGNTGGFLDTIG
jgi:hypothetical protein